MLKKDLGLLVLILVVGLVVAILNPRFLSPINLGNTANLIGLFGLFSLGAGIAVLMISSDMEEVIGVSDRIVVMREGRIAGFLERAEFSEENVMRLAVGRRDLQAAEAVSC